MSYDRFYIIAFLLVLMWGTTFYFLFAYGAAVSQHPCSICAEKINESLVCYGKQTYQPIQVIFQSDGVISNTVS